MSQLIQRAQRVSSSLEIRRTTVLAGLLALTTLAVLAALTIAGSSTDKAGSTVAHQAATRPDGGPSESAVAAALAPRSSTGPSESAIAAAVGTSRGSTAPAIPGESAIPAAITRPRDQPSRGPDESRIAASIAAP